MLWRRQTARRTPLARYPRAESRPVSGIFRTQEKAVACDCCHRDTHVFYTHPFYSYDDIEALCPECIASGRAAAELEGEFVIRDHVSQEIGTAWEDLEQQGIAESIEWLGLQPEPEDRPYIRNGGSMVGCLFRCLHCSQHILHVDLD